MHHFHLIKQFFLSMIFGLLSISAIADGARIAPLMQKELDDFINKEGVMLVVEYGPGMSSYKHRHNAHTFVYVLEGSVVMQVAGSDPVTLGVGDTFYESPIDIHLISKNASKTHVAKFVVFSLKDKDLPVLIPVR